MQDVVGEAADSMQAGRMVEVGDERHRPGVAPARRLQRITQQGEYAVAVAQSGQGPPGNVAAADDQKSFHRRIVAIRRPGRAGAACGA